MNVSYVYQDNPAGLGHAIYCAHEKVGREPFYVMLGDVLVPNNNVLPAMRKISNEHNGANVCAVMPVPREEVNRFGVISGTDLGNGVWKIDGLVEKPAVEDAPSNLAIFGRYLLSATVMDLLKDAKPTTGGEIQLTDALDAVLQTEEMYAYVVNPEDGFDTGTLDSWMDTNIKLYKRKYGSLPSE